MGCSKEVFVSFLFGLHLPEDLSEEVERADQIVEACYVCVGGACVNMIMNMDALISFDELINITYE